MEPISKTTLYGFLTNTFLAIAIKPDLVDFLPPAISEYTKGFAVLFAFVFGYMKSKHTPDVSDVVKVEERVNHIAPVEATKKELKVYE